MFEFDENLYCTMPAHFGGHSRLYAGIEYRDVTNITLIHETDLDQLSRYVPSPFEITVPALVIQYSQGRRIDWMSGGQYNLLAAGVPVRFRGRKEEPEGVYSLVIWEDHTAPIIGGREQQGIPKIYGDVLSHQQLNDDYYYNVGYDGHQFFEMSLKNAGSWMPAEQLNEINQSRRQNLFGWRYIPNIGKPGAALSHPTLYPSDFVTTAMAAGEAEFGWTRVDPVRVATQAHIINALASLPIGDVLSATITKGSNTLLIGSVSIPE